jgi:hypothetical protein
MAEGILMTDREYYQRRVQQERTAAESAKSLKAHRAHIQLARSYEAALARILVRS